MWGLQGTAFYCKHPSNPESSTIRSAIMVGTRYKNRYWLERPYCTDTFPFGIHRPQDPTEPRPLPPGPSPRTVVSRGGLRRRATGDAGGTVFSGGRGAHLRVPLDHDAHIPAPPQCSMPSFLWGRTGTTSTSRPLRTCDGRRAGEGGGRWSSWLPGSAACPRVPSGVPRPCRVTGARATTPSIGP